jgi:hypothetical protein
MSFQLVGQVVGGTIGGPWGALIGGMIGGAIDQSLAPDGPGAGDLTAPGLQLGRQLPRVYGRVRLPCNPIWASEFRATEHSSGGKGGPSGPSSYTYSLDMLCAIADGSNVIAVTRIWVNKKLVFTALADSTDASVINSQDTDYWSSFELLAGGPSQVPWSTYEDAVGAANAPAYRNLCTIGFADLQCGGGKTPPAIEVEVITAGTQGDVDPLTLLQSRFIDSIADDESAYDRGAPDISATGVTLSEGAATISAPDGDPHRLFYSPTGLASNGTDAITFEAIIRLDAELPISPTPGVTFNWVGEATHRFNWPSSVGYLSYDTSGSLGVEGQTDDGMVGIDMHVALVFGSTSLRAYAGPAGGTSTLIYENVGNFIPDTDEMEVTIGDGIGGGPAGMVCSGFRVRQEEVYTGGGFTAPSAIPPPDGFYDTWTPQTVTLDDIISDELQLNPEVPSTDFDVTDLSSIEVIGYTAAGSQSRTVQELCEVHYVDVVPGNPIRFQRRGTTSVSTIPFVDTGVGVDDPSGPFTGLKRGNADERPAVAALRFPLIDRDHEAGYERGDRLSTDSDDVRTIETRVVMGAEKAKGRAITATLLDKVRSHTSQFPLSDKYAKLEPADVYTPEDNDGNSYRLRAVRFSYADGVKSIDWELDDTTALVETGLTDTNYTPSIEIATPGEAEVLPLDIPLQRVQDDNPGYLAAVKCSDESRVYYYESPSDTTYTEVAQFPLDAVFGTVSTITGTPSIVATDTGCSVTVDVGDGTLAAITDATLLLDNTANRFVIGAYGREVIGQFRDCTLSAPGIYVLSGFLWGLNGTGQYVDDLIAGDDFCLLNENGGVKHIDRTSAQLGVAHYIKAVPERRSQASITGEAFTNSGVALKPLSGVNPHAERDSGSGDITITWDRQTRYPTRFGGDLGDSCPLGEESERYQVRLYTDNTFATLLRTFDVVTTSEVTYTSAQRTTDSHTPITAALYFDVRQISATVGEGYALQATL